MFLVWHHTHAPQGHQNQHQHRQNRGNHFLPFHTVHPQITKGVMLTVYRSYYQCTRSSSPGQWKQPSDLHQAKRLPCAKGGGTASAVTERALHLPSLQHLSKSVPQSGTHNDSFFIFSFFIIKCFSAAYSGTPLILRWPPRHPHFSCAASSSFPRRGGSGGPQWWCAARPTGALPSL